MTRAELIQFINANIYPNGRNQITAPMVRDSILAVVGFLGDAAVKDIGAVLENNTDLVTGGAVYDAIRAYLSSVMKMVGETTTDVITNPTANPVYVDGEPHTAQKGDVVVYGYKEFWWTGSIWKELGDEASWALKTISITGTGDLAGGGTLEANRTLDLTQSAKDKLAHGETAFSWLESYSTNRLRLKYPYSYLNARKGLILEEETDYTNTPADFVKQVVTVGETEYTILRSKLPIVSDSFISAGGISPGGGGGGGGIDPVAMWRLLTNDPSLTQYDNYTKISADHINFPVTSVVGLTGAVSAAQIAAALGLGSLAYQSALYIGTTAVQSTSQSQDLSGIGNLMIGNNKAVYMNDSGGTGRQIMIMSSANALQIGYGMNALSSGGGVALYGKTLTIYTGADRTNALSINASQVITFANNTRYANAKSISFQDNPSEGTAVYREALSLISTNVLRIGYGQRTSDATAIYGNTIYFFTNASGTSAARYIMTGGSFRPNAASSYDLGTSTYKWRNAYIDTIYENGTALSSKYLALAGGTMTGGLTISVSGWGNQLTINNSNTTAEESIIRFARQGTYVGGLGINTSNAPIFNEVGVADRILYHSGNANKSDVAWNCSDLFATNIYGNGTFQSNASYYGLSVGSFVGPWYGVKAYMTWDHGSDMGIARIATSHVISGLAIGFGRSEYNFAVPSSATITDYVYIKDNGYVGLGGQSNPQYTLDVSGVIHATTGIYTDGWFSGGGVASSSDRRLKKNIKNFAYTPKLLLAIRPREWDWKDGSAMVGHAAGFVAQEIEPIMPYAVDGTRNYKALFYDRFHALEIAGLQDHERRIVDLERAVKERDAKIEMLEKKLKMN